MAEFNLKKWMADLTLTVMGNQPICDMNCVPSTGGEPILGAGDPNPRIQNPGPNEFVNYYPGNTRPNPNYKKGCCIVTGDEFCGHPFRNALQPHHMRKPEIVQRWLAAKKHLAKEEAARAGA